MFSESPLFMNLQCQCLLLAESDCRADLLLCPMCCVCTIFFSECLALPDLLGPHRNVLQGAGVLYIISSLNQGVSGDTVNLRNAVEGAQRQSRPAGALPSRPSVFPLIALPFLSPHLAFCRPGYNGESMRCVWTVTTSVSVDFHSVAR